MPGILKIGMTERTPEKRLMEANSSDTWRPPTPYFIEFAKKVINPKQKEATIHTLLSQYTERINPKREFFRVSKEEVNCFFNLMDGEYWKKAGGEEEEAITEEDEEEEEAVTEEDEVVLEETKTENLSQVNMRKGSRRDLKKYFTDEQRIRHTIGINKTWIGVYNIFTNSILCNGLMYYSLSAFVVAHNKKEIPNRTTQTANGWVHCECEINGKWVLTSTL